MSPGPHAPRLDVSTRSSCPTGAPRPTWFRADRCIDCGDCFSRCRYVGLSPGEARDEIRRLASGAPTRAVLQRCIGCAACDVFCAAGARPHGLILGRWNERYRAEGLPARAAYLLPYHRPNLHDDMQGELTPRERDLVSAWSRTAPRGVVLFPGCNLLVVPRLLDQPALAGLTVAGDLSVCCGEPFYRMGLLEAGAEVARGLARYHAQASVEKMIFGCPACLNMFRTVMPERYGVSFDFDCEYLGTWLLGQIDAGKIAITHPLRRAVTVHDSCHGRLLGDEIMATSRALCERLGGRIVEEAQHHEDGLCCGVAAGCNRFLPQDMLRAARRALQAAAQTGTDELLVYCTGCYLMLNAARCLLGTRQRVVHILELLAEATGAPLPRLAEERARKMLRHTLLRVAPKLLSRKRLRVSHIDVKRSDAAPHGEGGDP